MTITVVTPPAGQVCTLAEAKAYLRVGHGSEDALIADLLQAATARIEADTGLALVARTLQRRVSRWRGEVLALRPAPVSEMIRVEHVEDGVITDVTDRFALEPGRPALVFCHPGGTTLATGNSVSLEVRYRTGFGGADDVPEDLVTSVKLMLSHLYQARAGGDRDAAESLPRQLDQMLAPWRQVRL